MTVHVVAIHVPARRDPSQGPYAVIADLEVDAVESYEFKVTPLGYPGEDLSVVSSERSFVDRFRDTLSVTWDVERLIGLAIQQGSVHLPQVIAA